MANMSCERISDRFSRLKLYLETCAPQSVVNFREILSNPSITPPPNDFRVIPTNEEFSASKMIEIFLANLIDQNVSLKCDTLRLIVQFFDGTVTKSRDETALQTVYQLLVLFTKADVKEFLPYPSSNDELMWETYDETMRYFFKHVYEKVLTTIVVGDKSIKQELKQFLKKSYILQVISYCVNFVFADNLIKSLPIQVVDVEKIIDDKFDVYFFVDNQFLLKGATLRNGILINRGSLPSEIEYPLLRKSDLYTITIHEFAQFTCRYLANDWNFSTPFKVRSDGRTSPLKDSIIKTKHLEMGRFVELVLFDGIQPDWKLSSEEAAKAFLDRLDASDASFPNSAIDVRPPPLIPKDERKRLSLVTARPSLSCGLNWQYPRSSFF